MGGCSSRMGTIVVGRACSLSTSPEVTFYHIIHLNNKSERDAPSPCALMCVYKNSHWWTKAFLTHFSPSNFSLGCILCRLWQLLQVLHLGLQILILQCQHKDASHCDAGQKCRDCNDEFGQSSACSALATLHVHCSEATEQRLLSLVPFRLA